MISILTVTHNAFSTLAENIQSVEDQDIDVEHILIDGASSDGTLDIVKGYHHHLSRVVSEPDKGIYDAMNKGINIASGEIIGILNADDYYPDTSILSRVKEVFQDESVDACYGDLIYVDKQDKGKIVRYWRSGKYEPKNMYWGWMPPHPTFFARASVYKKYGKFNLDIGSAADYEIMLRFLLKHQIKVAYIPHVIVHMRSGGISNANLSNRWVANKMDRKAWEVNDLKPYPWTLYAKPLRKVGQWLVKS